MREGAMDHFGCSGVINRPPTFVFEKEKNPVKEKNRTKVTMAIDEYFFFYLTPANGCLLLKSVKKVLK